MFILSCIIVVGKFIIGVLFLILCILGMASLMILIVYLRDMGKTEDKLKKKKLEAKLKKQSKEENHV